MTDRQANGAEWWRSAVIYQVYPRSFADASGDGIGDLPGATAHLADLADLGVDAVWLSPFYVSPQHDGGYDVADYCDVDPLFGTIADFDALLARAHELGMRVIVDIVPNHSSSEHRWFREALVSGRGSPERARYIFRDGAGVDGVEPPNNWRSVFGGPAWTRVTEHDGSPGQWYLHLFDATQPDFDWENPWVAEQFDRILRFWLDRGVDGFRIDVANGLAKKAGLPDWSEPDANVPTAEAIALDPPMWAQEHVHPIWRRWRGVADEYAGDRVLVAEAWVNPLDRLARWVRPDELHQAFNFSYLLAPWDADEMRAVINDSLAAFTAVDAPPTWVLSNHDTVRHPTRLALPTQVPHGVGIGPASAHRPDPDVAGPRGRAASLLMLALPGAAYLYQGEELGLPEAIDLPDEARRDPTWFRTRHESYGRDGCRVPLPWAADAPAFGFSPNGRSWLPQPGNWALYAFDRQVGDPASTLELYREALRLRSRRSLGTGTVEWRDSPPGTLRFVNEDVAVWANVDGQPMALEGREVLLASRAVSDAVPPDTTVWLRAS